MKWAWLVCAALSSSAIAQSTALSLVELTEPNFAKSRFRFADAPFLEHEKLSEYALRNDIAPVNLHYGLYAKSLEPMDYFKIENANTSWQTENVVMLVNADMVNSDDVKLAKACFDELKGPLLESVISGYKSVTQMNIFPTKTTEQAFYEGMYELTPQHSKSDFATYENVVFYSGYSVPAYLPETDTHIINHLPPSTRTHRHPSHFLGLALKLIYVSKPFSSKTVNSDLSQPLPFENAVAVRFKAYSSMNVSYLLHNDEKWQLPEHVYFYQYPLALDKSTWLYAPGFVSQKEVLLFSEK